MEVFSFKKSCFLKKWMKMGSKSSNIQPEGSRSSETTVFSLCVYEAAESTHSIKKLHVVLKGAATLGWEWV